MLWRDLIALLSIPFSVAVLPSDLSVGLPLLLRSLQHPKAEKLLLVRDLDEIHIIERRGGKKKPSPAQGSPSSSGEQKKSPSSTASQSTPRSSTGPGSIGSSPRNPRWEQGSPGASASQEKEWQAGQSPKSQPNLFAQSQTSLSQLRISQPGPSGSTLSPAQSNIGRSRSQSPERGARTPVSDPGSPGNVSPGHSSPYGPRAIRSGYDDINFNGWLNESKSELEETKRRAARMGTNTGGRTGQRAAQTEIKKAETAKVNVNFVYF